MAGCDSEGGPRESTGTQRLSDSEGDGSDSEDKGLGRGRGRLSDPLLRSIAGARSWSGSVPPVIAAAAQAPPSHVPRALSLARPASCRGGGLYLLQGGGRDARDVSFHITASRQQQVSGPGLSRGRSSIRIQLTKGAHLSTGSLKFLTLF
jgi:hypothetical protein